jgi:hypothetical protein
MSFQATWHIVFAVRRHWNMRITRIEASLVICVVYN